MVDRQQIEMLKNKRNSTLVFFNLPLDIVFIEHYNKNINRKEILL